VPEDRYGELRVGQAALVTVDSFPDVIFQAKVVRIADQAEFTPRNVQTDEGRRTTVFAVELSIEDSSGQLKPGMPATVRFEN
jgi:HlyD family secretion protein